MKRLLVVSILLIFTATVSSQVVLTFKDNAPLAGDSVISQEIQFTFPGNSGSNQIWDFSKIQFINKNRVSNTSEMPAKHPEELSNSNLVLNDHGYEYFLRSSEDNLEELGLVSKEYSFVFSDPMLKMKYPFSYGDKFTDNYGGVGSYMENRKVEVSGKYTVAADGYGTLILPEKILKDAMRLRIEETGVQINPCNSIERKIVRYLWYVPSVRYAVLGFSTSEHTISGQEPKILNSGFISEKIYHKGDITALSQNLNDHDLAETSVVLFPNPFNKKLSYNYFLRKKMPVSIELMDMAGRSIINLLDNQIQPEGLHSGELDVTNFNLKMGVYYLRFSFGKKVVISKVVKI
ncbi:MAG: T9SS type A sorting domain-containing protein [Bacteroidota bacterium]